MYRPQHSRLVCFLYKQFAMTLTATIVNMYGLLMTYVLTFLNNANVQLFYNPVWTYEGVSKRIRTGRLERELKMVQFSDTRCSYIAIL